jgi:hypothetical protein
MEDLMAESLVRASDADRERVAAILRGAAGQGLLTLAEVDERLGRVYAATYVGDLPPVTADLPEGGRRLAPADPGARSRARAVARVHLAGYVGLVLLMVAIWVATGADYYFWPVWPAIGMLPRGRLPPGGRPVGRRPVPHLGTPHPRRLRRRGRHPPPPPNPRLTRPRLQCPWPPTHPA